MGQNNNPNQNRPQDQRGRNHVLAEGRFGAPLEGLGLRVVLDGRNLLVQLVAQGQSNTALTISLPKPVAGLWKSILDGNGGNGGNGQ